MLRTYILKVRQQSDQKDKPAFLDLLHGVYIVLESAPSIHRD